jgi:ketosteroid isomerase-like protein
MRRVLFAVVLIAAFTSLAQGQDTSAIARKAIEANSKIFIDAFNKGDAAGVAALYAMDAKLLPPNEKLVEGQENIQTFWGRAATAGVKMVSLTTSDVTASGVYAIETGKFVTTMPTASGGTTTDEGKFVVVWQRQGSGWKIIRDIFNSDMPAR